MKIFAVSLVLLLCFVIAIDASIPREPGPQANPPVTQSREPEKESAIRNSLALLLTNSGVRVELSLPENSGQTYKALQVRWQSNAVAGPNNLLKQPSLGSFAILAADKKAGALPRERSLDLSPNQLLAIGVDSKGNLRSWKLMLDPRLVRAETPNANGELKGEELYLADVEFWIAVPDDPSLKEVRLYQPHWTGKDFQLELVGTLTVE